VSIQQLQGQLQTQHSADTSNYITDYQNIKSKTNYRQAIEENTLCKEIKKQSSSSSSNNNNNNNNNNNANNFINTNLSFYWELRNVKYKYLERIIIIQLISIQLLFMYVQT
jgi:hypothetical protein